VVANYRSGLERKTSDCCLTNLSPVEKVLCLQNVDVFRHATTEMLAYIGSIAHEVRLEKGATIFAEQDVSDAMYIVITGRVRLTKDGRDVLVAESNQTFGTWALFDNQPRVVTASALEDVHLLKIASEDFYELLADHNEITPAIFRAVIERVKSLIPD
jgi:CRP/FNR family transcriptional regulator, cyclic AMP receptor protein